MRAPALHNRLHLLAILLIAMVSMIIYANTLKNGFVYDDRYSIVNNDLIKDFGNWPKLLTKDYFNLSGEMSYRPIVTLTYFFDYALFGMNPWGYHLINTLLHTINGALVYMFIALIMPPTTISYKLLPVNCLQLLISLLFVTHPILTEAVNAVSFREDLLAFLFYVATLSLYLVLRKPAADYRPLSAFLLYLFSGILYFLALLSKEMAATFPLIVYCYEWFYSNRKRSAGSILFNRCNMGYIAVTVLYLYVRFYCFHNPRESEFVTWSIMERFLTMPYILVSYLKLTLFPLSLSVDYYLMPVKSLFSASFLLPFAAILLLVATAVIIERREKGIAFGLIFFIVSLLPVYNLIPIANPLAERYLYLPALGICLSIGFMMIKLKPQTLFMSFLAIVCIFSISVVKRNEAWRDDYSLWSDAARKVPNSSRPYNDMGNVLYEKGRLDDAVKQYKTAIRLKPDFLEPHNNLGLIYSEQGRLDDAIAEFKAALILNPKQADVRFNLGNLYNKQGRHSEAVKEFKALLKINPNESQYHHALGYAYDKIGKSDEALDEFKAAVRLNYGFVDAHYYLGSIYLKKGFRDEARKEFETVLKLRPNFPVVRQLLDSLERDKR